MKHIVLTGGFSAGHITPNLALIPSLQAQGYRISYIGGKQGIEQRLVSQTDVPYYGISGGKLRRYLDLENVADLFRILVGTVQAFFLLRRLKPDLIFSKGGFVACPPVWAGWLNRIPIIIHESDLSPGLANRLSTPFASKICYSFPETKSYLSADKAVQTGIPIRETLLAGLAEMGREICGFRNSKPVVLIMGGSQGSALINQTVRVALDQLLSRFNVCHLCGRGNVEAIFASTAGYKQFEYVDQDLPHLFAMADVVVSRAGATTLFELLALRKPHLLIPLSLSASRGDQILNAESFAQQGYSQVLAEDALTADSLMTQLRLVYDQRDKFTAAMAQSELANGLAQVLAVINQEMG